MTIVRILLLSIAPATVFRFAQLFADQRNRFWDDALIPIFAVRIIATMSLASHCPSRQAVASAA